jgi:hypothetical protein
MLRLIVLVTAVLVIGFLVEHLETAFWIAVALLVLFLVIRRWGYGILVAVYKPINRIIPWHRLWTPLAVLNLDAFRVELRAKNLVDTPKRPDLAPADWQPAVATSRSADGAFNDLEDPDMGRAGMRFGRNFPLDKCIPDDASLLDPNPRTVSRRLMVRRDFVPATSLNLLAAAWIQFQVHDWMAHRRAFGDEGMDTYQVPLADDDEFPENPMRIVKTVKDSDGDAATPPTFVNTESHWWDCSGIYGKSLQAQRDLRSLEGGKLKTETVDVSGRPDRRLLQNPDERFPGIDHTGFFDNYWIGLSIFHTIFTLEHNAICDALSKEYPTWDDEHLFQTARLINCALIAKIHTVEWTPGILSHPALKVSMNANWWGLLGENLKKSMGRVSDTEELSGIIGSGTDHHTASYSLTEEFTAVYRLHPLIPDSIVLRSSRDGSLVAEKGFLEVQGNATRPAMQDVTVADLFYSFGVSYPGAIRLFNYPDTLRNFQRIDGKEPPMDLAAVDILRDRERGVPRYNSFRTLLHKQPARSFADITSNKEWASVIEEVYGGDIEKVDLMVGLLAEDLPEGFGFSDTAFRIFILMASRRLKSDRFLTKDYNDTVYTRLGLDWVDDNGMASVLLRHYPALAPALRGVANPFAPWNTSDQTRPISG